MIGKVSSILSKLFKVGPAHVPAEMVRGLAVQMDFNIACRAETLSAVMDRLEEIRQYVFKGEDVLHLEIRTCMLVGDHGANVPLKRVDIDDLNSKDGFMP